MRDDELDLLIDKALRTYAVPRSGLEMRILSSVATEQRVRTNWAGHRWLVWVLSVPLVACVILLLTIPDKRQTRSNVASRTYQQDHHPVAKVQSASPETLRVSPRRRSNKPHPTSVSTTARTNSVPKLDMFPSPQPLRQEEKALVALASQSDSSAAQQALAQSKQQLDNPLEISAIRIPPITTPDEGNN